MPKINQETGKVYLGANCQGSTLPATCTMGDTFLKVDEPAGQQLFACTATNTWTLQGGGGAGAVDSVFSRTGAVVAASNDYTWAQVNKATSSLADITTRSYADLQSIPATFAPSAHTHVKADVTDFAHTHAQADVTNLTTDLSAKAPLASPTFTGTVTLPTPFTLGAVSVTPTGTELNFVDGVTSAIQTQLDGKAAASHTHAAADINSGTIATARLGSGTANSSTFLRGDQTWATPSGGAGVPAGAVVMILSGACATTLGAGWTEVALGGKFLLVTTNGAADIGGTGGQDSVTEVLNHTHPVTDPGHTHLTQRYPTATGGSSGFTIDTSMSGTLANNTLPTASATTGITTANPVGGVASIDNRPAFVKVILCQKD